jgi:hypothetical protein
MPLVSDSARGGFSELNRQIRAAAPEIALKFTVLRKFDAKN